MKRHPTDLRLEAFLLDQRLKSGPPRRPGDLPGSESIPPIPPLPRDHRTLTFAAALAQERSEAPELFVELLRRPIGARVSLVVSDPRKRLAGEMLPVFTSLEIHREALAALSFLRQAMEAERAGLELVSAVASFVRRAQYRPELRFEVPVGA